MKQEKTVFDEGRNNTSRYRTGPRAGRSERRSVDAAKREDRVNSGMRYYFRWAKKEAEHEAQHGPVKIIMKDGKLI